MEWMDFNKFFNKNLNRLIFSILITVAAFVFMNVITQTVFFINDDTNIMYTVAGYYTNLPADHPFINVCLSYFFQFLYTLNKTIPWYGVFHVIVTLFSITMIIKVIFDNCYKKENRLLFHISFDIIKSCYFIYISNNANAIYNNISFDRDSRDCVAL